MYKWVTITVKKSMPAQVGLSLLERIRFFLGGSVRYREYSIRGCFREIFVGLERGGEIPEIPAEITESVKYSYLKFMPKYLNGEGYYGETAICSTTLDGEQSLNISGPTTTDVKKALEHFMRGELPPIWEPEMARKSSQVTRIHVQGDVSHHYSDAGTFG